jgi:hypothetical protein
MSVAHNFVQKRGRKNCSGCEFSSQRIVGGKVKEQDGEAAHLKEWRWVRLANALDGHDREHLLYYLRRWGSFFIVAPTVKVSDVLGAIENGSEDEYNAAIELLRRLVSERERKHAHRRRHQNKRFVPVGRK